MHNQRRSCHWAVAFVRLASQANSWGASPEIAASLESNCSAFLGRLVLYIILVMMDHSGALWGEACYPVVEAF